MTELELSVWQKRLEPILNKEPDNRHVLVDLTANRESWQDQLPKVAVQPQQRYPGIVWKGSRHAWLAESKEAPRIIMCKIPRPVEERYLSCTGLEEAKEWFPHRVIRLGIHGPTTTPLTAVMAVTASVFPLDLQGSCDCSHPHPDCKSTRAQSKSQSKTNSKSTSKCKSNTAETNLACKPRPSP